MGSHREARDAVQTFMEGVRCHNRNEAEFLQAVEEWAESIMPFVLEHPEYRRERILERMTEPDRIVIFRVTWEDDRGRTHVNRAWRIQFNNSIGPYKGGLRFHPNVNLSVLKFLGFEQCFKNALTGLPMGGAKGGSNFDPRGRSDRDVMRFCQSMMVELHRHIGEDTDVPAGDIGVGAREISYLFGQYKRMENHFAGVLTGKGLTFGGSLVRTEATGYGAAYLTQRALEQTGDSLEGKRCLLSGSGNVALYCAEKLIALGGKVITLSDSDGTVVDIDGITEQKLAWIKDLKEQRRGRIREYAEAFGCEYRPGARPWRVEADAAFPCATENELDGDDARALIANDVCVLAEGANMPATREAVRQLRDAGVLFLPGKAANAGGVAVSGLEQSQNSLRISWSHDEVDRRLKTIMADIHAHCVEYGTRPDGTIDYLTGANLAGFVKLADAMLAHGLV